jgi:hypothetical protein
MEGAAPLMARAGGTGGGVLPYVLRLVEDPERYGGSGCPGDAQG